MKVILFGATGMVGQGVLRECLLDPTVETVLAVGRSPVEPPHAKLRNLVHADFTRFGDVADQLTGYDACFFCLGVSSVGMKEDEYRHITYDFTLAAAEVLARQSPAMTFIYVSGTGTDSTEKGRSMWARVKGQTENALLRLPFKAAYMFRPGVIQPLHGIKSKTTFYRAAYVVMTPVLLAMRAVAPGAVITTEQVGRAMINAAKGLGGGGGAPKRLVENRDIAALAAAGGA
jgi:uncharacterized protein YbjT (DUF2867 family)